MRRALKWAELTLHRGHLKVWVVLHIRLRRALRSHELMIGTGQRRDMLLSFHRLDQTIEGSFSSLLSTLLGINLFLLLFTAQLIRFGAIIMRFESA